MQRKEPRRIQTKLRAVTVLRDDEIFFSFTLPCFFPLNKHHKKKKSFRKNATVPPELYLKSGSKNRKYPKSPPEHWEHEKHCIYYLQRKIIEVANVLKGLSEHAMV